MAKDALASLLEDEVAADEALRAKQAAGEDLGEAPEAVAGEAPFLMTQPPGMD